MSKYKKVKIYIGGVFLNEYIINKVDDNIFEYKDESCINKISLANDKFVLSRENAEFLLIIDSTKTTAYYKLKELNYELNILINYFDKLEENNNIVFAYQLETTDKEIKLVLED